MRAKPLYIFVILVSSLFLLSNKAQAEILNIPITEDTYIQLLDAEENRSENPELHVGYARDVCPPFSPWDSSYHYCPSYRSRSLLKIPLDIILENNIQSEDILSAKLHLLQYGMRSWVSFSIEAYPLLEEWNESEVTWTSYPIFGNIISQTDILRANNWQAIDISEWTRQVIESPEINNGILLKGTSENRTASYFWSSDCLASGEETTCFPKQQPFVSILYEPKSDGSDHDDNNIPTITELDTKPPTTPVILSEYTYSTGHSDTIRWQKSTDNVTPKPKYLVEMATDSEFRNIVANQKNVAKTFSTFHNLTIGKTYFYRVKAIDEAGNMSDYSNITSSKPILTESRELIHSELLTYGSIHESHAIHHNTHPEIKGISTSTTQVHYPKIPNIPTCHVILKVQSGTYEVKDCTTPPPRIGSVINNGKSSQNVYNFSLYTSIQPKVRLKIDHINCTPRTFWRPITWFKCIEETKNTTYHTIIMRNILIPKLHDSKGTLRTEDPISMKSNHILRVYVPFDPYKRKVFVLVDQRGYIKVSDTWIDIHVTSKRSNIVTIPKSTGSNSNSNKYSSFFNSHIGVTQWHGYTAFQKPHTGIDFGSYQERILSPADGVIAFAGWDNYYGQCLSGGNILIIRHNADYHTAYFHLKDLNNENGTQWKIGDTVKRNQYIGTSGNSGAWNCQPLGYHLHFELRKNRSQSSHVNPVPYIDVDWNQIPTIGWRQYPGRLTGDNPHPTF